MELSGHTQVTGSVVGLYIKHDHLVVTRGVGDVDDCVHSGCIWLATIQGMCDVAETSEGL